MRSAAALAGLAAWLAAAASAQDAGQGAVTFSGHLKSTLAAARTSLGPPQSYVLDANRLRLELKGQVTPNLGVDLQYDNELLLGTYVGTPEFAVRSRQPRRTAWDLDQVYARGGKLQGRHALRRAAATVSAGATDLRIGRQRVAWGTGRFWSPLDLLNPVDPVALEPGERQGVDALLVEHKRSATSRASLVYAPARQGRDHVLAQWHANARGVDYSLTAGRVPEGTLAGVDVAGQIRGAGIRAEWTVTHAADGQRPQRVLLGWDYAFPNTFALTAEFYYDGSGTDDPARYDLAGLLAGRRQTVARRYAGLSTRYELTPLLRWENWLVRNVDDRSWYVSPRLTWSLRQDLDLAAGVQTFGGPARSEFGVRRTLWFAYAQWFF